MTLKSFVSLRTAGICGIQSPLIAFTCIGLAILYSPWFSWTDNWLSDLGGFPGERPVWSAHGLSSILFNTGLIIAGILGICLALGIRNSEMLRTRLGNGGTIFLFLTSCTLIGIDVFPETTGTPHEVFSNAFFILIGLSLSLVGASLIKSSERTLGWFTIALFIFTLCSIPLFLAPRPMGSNAVAEMFPIVSVAAFSIVFGVELLKQASNDKRYEKSDDEGYKKG